MAPGATLGSLAAQQARNLGLEVVDPLNNPGDRRGRPPQGRDPGSPGATRLRAAGAQRHITPAAGDTPVTGGPDAEAGEGSGLKRKRKTVLGAANVRRPILGSGLGKTILGA